MLSGSFLQFKVFRGILLEIWFLSFGRNTLTRIIIELAARAVNGHNTALNAQNLFIIYFGSILAIAAGAGELFSKQHAFDLFLASFESLYIIDLMKSTVILRIMKIIPVPKTTASPKTHIGIFH